MSGKNGLVTIRTVVMLLVAFLARPLLAVPPTPEAVAKWQAEGTLEKELAPLKAFKEAGGCAPSVVPFERFRDLNLATSQVVDTIHMLMICIDFPDYKYNQQTYAPGGGSPVLNTTVFAPTSSFDSLVFSRQSDPIHNPTGSMADFYYDNSFGKIVMTGDVKGWYTAPQNYSYYENNGKGLNGKAPELVQAAIQAAANDGVNFSLYDNDNDNTIEFVIICHAGPGAETGAYGIWSHKSTVGVTIGGYNFMDYSINPEEQGGQVSNVGVYCHETGHLLALPDLYDIGGTADGIGAWSVMSGGTWNGNGKSPANFDAYCKLASIPNMLRFDSLTGNTGPITIPAAETTPYAIKLKNPAVGSTEYWVVENRQPIGNDAFLPGSGLVVYHVDPAVPAQNNPARYKVAVEQADGLNNLSAGQGSDAGDPWPGTSNARNFTNFTTPDSKTNTGLVTQIGIWNISNSMPVMTAEFDVTGYSRPFVQLFASDSVTFSDAAPGGDNDGLYEQGETIKFNMRVKNFGRSVNNGKVTLTCDDPDLVLPTTPVLTTTALNPVLPNGTDLSAPISFSIPANFVSRIVNFTATMTVDSLTVVDRWQYQFHFQRAIGRPQVLVVDDDNTLTDEQKYVDALNRIGIPNVVWSKKTSGSPTFTTLSAYRHVLWHGGGNLNGNSFGIPTLADITALKAFMDAGGNVCLAGDTTAMLFQSLDSAFIRNYFHATVDSAKNFRIFRGYPGSEIGNGIKFRFSTGPLNGRHRFVKPFNGGTPFLYLSENSGNIDTLIGPAAVYFSGGYKSVITTMMIPYAATTFTGYAPPDTLLARIVGFFSGTISTDVLGGDDGVLPRDFSLSQNYPNPFNPSTTIRYSIAADAFTGSPNVRLVVYNLMGQEVRTLIDSPQSSGQHELVWDGKDAAGKSQATGVYFYRLTVGTRSESRKMMLLK